MAQMIESAMAEMDPRPRAAQSDPADRKKRSAAGNGKRHSVNIPMCLAAVLFCLTLISIHLISGLYAMYISHANDGASARVIRFGNLTLTESGDFDSGSAKIIPGVNLTKRAQVDFTGSESATYVFVALTPTGGWTTLNNVDFSLLAGKMQWSVAAGWTFLSSSAGTYVYYRELTPGVALESADVIANNGVITVSNQITKYDLQGLIDGNVNVSIKLRATVVQSGGFADAAAAWASVGNRN